MHHFKKFQNYRKKIFYAQKWMSDWTEDGWLNNFAFCIGTTKKTGWFPLQPPSSSSPFPHHPLPPSLSLCVHLFFQFIFNCYFSSSKKKHLDKRFILITMVVPGSLVLLFCQLIGQPVKSFAESVTLCRTRWLYVPSSVPQVIQT